MSSVATDYTNKVNVTDEVAEFPQTIVEEMRSHLTKYPKDRSRSALIPLLFVIQRERGYIDNPGVNFLAKFLNLEVTDIWETATFYSMFNLHPVGKYHIQMCKTLSCKIMGEPELTDHICSKLGIRAGETTKDGKFTVSRVECLGSCGTAPMMQIGFDYHENLTAEKLDKIIEECQ
ncbi:MAG: NAD(P)H-dependent oxidoreductase subunit E [Acidobacteria bacterium]|nr:MAG: NAD(P)H-dependent oxidoreductase subunit E [Acidobacteriota bacterium]REK01968.1 MAG: NAD(P)H-dependent oxidoreductase subunit E [Acidobacteriota bacterium]REK14924.1 MAG: NAD(P)H-dependent oxidoreductase subunit E [Acidobacteriota bacterium]REK45639.1 MAG: NAD(P)H-dependent oxidoreductase subunit E [Acidobacteriota bacterium]